MLEKLESYQKKNHSLLKQFPRKLFNYLREIEPNFNMDYANFVEESIGIHAAVYSLDDDGQSSRLCYATPSFHGRPRYDSVQISGEDGTKWFGKLQLLFSYQGLNLAFLEEYDFVDEHMKCLPEFGLPWVKLSGTLSIIPADAIDCLMYCRPDWKQSECYLLDYPPNNK